MCNISIGRYVKLRVFIVEGRVRGMDELEEVYVSSLK